MSNVPFQRLGNFEAGGNTVGIDDSHQSQPIRSAPSVQSGNSKGQSQPSQIQQSGRNSLIRFRARNNKKLLSFSTN